MDPVIADIIIVADVYSGGSPGRIVMSLDCGWISAVFTGKVEPCV